MSLTRIAGPFSFSVRAHARFMSSVIAAAAILGGCSDDEQPREEDRATTFSCADSFGASCGIACSAEAPCQTGMYCSTTSVCNADCTLETGCDAGNICGTNGACFPRGDNGEIVIDPNTPSGDGDNNQSPETCVEAKVEFNAVIPQVWLLLDRSSSMEEILTGTERRWDAIGSVLVGDPTDATDQGVVGEFQDLVAFGATFFSRESLDSCSELVLEETPLTLQGYDAINSLYLSLEPGTGTPTAEAYADLAARVAAAPVAEGPKIIIAATDGAPTKCGMGDAQTDVETAVSAAYANNIQTFVINVGDNDSDESHLQRVANLGQGLVAEATPPAQFYSAANQDLLKDAFRSIIGTAASCVFQLNGSVSAMNAAQGSVELLGQPLVYNTPDGWVLRSETELEITGAACETIQAGISEADLTIRFPCGTFIVK